MTRGERNNNPGNIREYAFDGVHWKGERATDDDPEFEEFDAPQDGLRALARVLLTYQRKHHLRTIGEIIERWAPGSENDTAAYVADCAERCGIGEAELIDLERIQNLTPLVKSIIWHENGRCIYSDNAILLACKDAY